jgi:hypothetical protein
MNMITPASQPDTVNTHSDLRKHEPRLVPRNGPQDARHVPGTRGQRLAQDAAEAAEVRRYQTHPVNHPPPREPATTAPFPAPPARRDLTRRPLTPRPRAVQLHDKQVPDKRSCPAEQPRSGPRHPY